MNVVTTSIGKRPTRVAVCPECGDLVLGGQCQAPDCRIKYPQREIEEALARPIAPASPTLTEARATRG